MLHQSTAYGRKPPKSLDELTRVGAGTPMGELLRRYWHPVGLAKDAGQTPRPVRVLGEDLILFRDGKGRPGLLHHRCAHRGSSLYYGRVEEEGIRCCYHGWMFAVDGTCVDQPCEPDNGAKTRKNIRQPYYVVQERYGLIFAYMGPPDKQPVLPRYNILEELGPGEFLEADDSSIGSGGATIVPCNWLQHFENVMDPFHVPILHGNFSGNQFVAKMSIMPKVKFDYTDRGVRSVQLRDVEAGTHRRITEAVLPTIRAVASPRAEGEGSCSLLGWVLPIDDTSFRIYSAGRVSQAGALSKIRSHFNGKLWHELSEEEHRKYPGDFEAQVSQGPITIHSEEHLASTDMGVSKLRHVFRLQLEAIAAGKDPMGVNFDADKELVLLEAGTSLDAKVSQP
ncbi:MAG: aromatic ring-hydroxylating dioxygenase subunit alpha [Proteobacteria bacterium]|nr:aromatic ring-hydroxylating dioxygenase subunit alpha [Pseudomonadota bacterium]